MSDSRTQGTILWRHARWRCESSANGSVWTGRLWVDDVIVSECAVDNARELFWIARKWLKAVAHESTPDSSPVPFAQSL